MRTLLVILLSCFCIEARGQLPPISAEELARHLGVLWWRVPKEQLPPTFSVQLSVVEKGKVTEVLISSKFRNTADLVVCASEREGRPYFSCSVGGMTAAKPVFHSWNLFLGHGTALPQTVGTGTHILAGTNRDPKHSVIATGSVDQLDAGIVLTLSPN